MKKCGECYHLRICETWNLGDMDNALADHCAMYETVKDTLAYYLGFCDGRKDNWTPVTEKLPKMLEGHFYSADVLATVLCTDGSAQMRVMTYGLPIGGNGTGWFDDEGFDYVVTAWMPLPEAYGGEDDE